MECVATKLVNQLNATYLSPYLLAPKIGITARLQRFGIKPLVVGQSHKLQVCKSDHRRSKHHIRMCHQHCCHSEAEKSSSPSLETARTDGSPSEGETDSDRKCTRRLRTTCLSMPRPGSYHISSREQHRHDV